MLAAAPSPAGGPSQYDPRPVAADLRLDNALDHRRMYEYRFRGIDQGARQRVWDVLAPWLWERMGRPSCVLDPAAGRFEFLNAVPAAERWAVDALDHGFARDAAVNLVIGDVLKVELPDRHFDGVFVSNFLEHLPTQDHIAFFLRRMAAAITPGGRIAILGPNFRYCAREYFDCADHVVPLTHVSVAEHLHAAGFDVEQILPRVLPYSFRGIFPPSPTLTRVYLRLPPAWRVLGKQLLVLARVPASPG
jgi:SAM-dependent methyltransferase